MAELTGIPTEGFFRSTASVRHHELSDLSRDEGALRDRLQASISGADRGTSRARKKLDKALHDLTHARATRTRAGSRSPSRPSTRRQAAVDQGELALAQLERDRDALSGARERRAEAETALAERRSLLEKARQAERLAAERDAAAGALRALSPGGRRRRRGRRPGGAAIRRRTRCRSSSRRSSACARSTAGSASCGRRWRARSRSSSRSRRSRPGGRCRAGPSRWSSIGILLAGGPVVVEVLGVAELGHRRPGRRRDHRGHRPGPRRASPCGSAAA